MGLRRRARLRQLKGAAGGRRTRPLFAWAGALGLLALGVPHAVAVESDWSDAVGGKWSDGSLWSTAPHAPNNDNPAGSHYDARVEAGGTPYIIMLDSNTRLDSLTLDSQDATIVHRAAVLQAGVLDINAGTYSIQSLPLQETRLRNTTVRSSAGTGQLSIGSVTATLENVTLAMDATISGLNVKLTIQDGLTLAGHDIRWTAGGAMMFYGSAPLDGMGAIVVDSRPSSSGYVSTLYAPAGTLTIGPDVTVSTGDFIGGSGGIVLGSSGSGTGVGLRNQGTVSCQTANMSVELTGNWVNEGTINVSNGTLWLGGSCSPDLMGDFIRSGGQVILSGTVQGTGQTLLLDRGTGSWDMRNARIIGTRIESHDDAELHVSGSSGSFVTDSTLAANMQMNASSNLRIVNHLALDAGSLTLLSGSSDNPTTLDFTGPTIVDGTGEIVFKGGGSWSRILSYTQTQSVVFGPGITFRGDSGGGSLAAQTSPIVVQGTIVSGPALRKISLTGPVRIEGVLQIDPGGEVPALNLANLSGGVLTGGTYDLRVAAKLRVGQAITTNAASLILSGPGAGVLIGATGSADALAGLTSNAAGATLRVMNGAALTLTQPFVSDGSLIVGAGGQLYMQRGLTVGLTGGISGAGLIYGNVRNAGLIEPGSAPGMPSMLGVFGDVTLDASSRMVLELGGATLGLFDRFSISGRLTTGGVLDVTLLDSYVPTEASEFDLLDGRSIEGSFASLALPELPSGLRWDTQHLYDTGAIAVVSVPEPAALSMLAANCLVLLASGRRRGRCRD